MSNPSNKTIVRTAFFIILLDLLGLGLLIPVQPFLAQKFGASPAMITLLGTAYAGMQFLFSPLWGAVSDRVGRRRVLLSTIAITCFGHILFTLSGSFELLLLARCITGLGAANLSTAQAVVTDVSDHVERTKNLGILGAAFGIGFILGPGLGGLLSQYSPILPPLFAAFFAAANWFFVFYKLPETRISYAPTQHISRFALFSSLRSSSFSPAVTWCFLITFVSTVAFSLMEYTISLFIQAHWLPISLRPVEESAALTTQYLIIVGITSALVQGFLIRRFAHRFPVEKILVIGLVTLVCAMSAIPIIASTESWPLFQLTAVLSALGSGLLSTSIAAYVSSNSDVDNQALVLSANQSSSALGRVIGPAIAGLLFQQWINLPYIVSAVLFVFLVVIAKAVLENAGVKQGAMVK